MTRTKRLGVGRASLAAAALVLLLGGCGAGDEQDGGVACDSEGRPAQVGGGWIITGAGERTGCADPTLEHDFKLGPATLDVVLEDPNQYDAGLQHDAAPAADGGPALDGGARPDGPPEAGVDASPDGGLPDGDAGAPADDAGPAPDGGSPPVDAGAPADDAGVPDGDAGAADGGVPPDAAPDAPPDAASDAPQVDAGQVDAAPPIVYQAATLRLRSPIPDFELQGTVRGDCVNFQTAESVAGVGTITYSFRGAYESFGRRVEGKFSGSGPGTCNTSGTFTLELE